MKKRKAAVFLISTVMVLMLAAGCADNASNKGGKSEKSGKKQFRVGFALKTQDSPYFVKLAKEMKNRCEKEGWKCTVLDANGDTSKEAENMETFIAQGMDLIFLDSVDPDACIPGINKAYEAKIPVINVDSGVGEGAKDVTTVYSNNKQNGRLVGKAYGDKIGKDTPIKAILLSGAKGNVAGRERRQGLFCGIIESRTGCTQEEAWKEAEAFDKALLSAGKASDTTAKFTVAGQGWGNWTEEDGLAAAEDLVTANKDLTCILGENDQMLFGGMTALKNAGLTNVDIVAGADGAQKAMDLIKEGKYFATGLNSPVLVAQGGIKIAKEILVDGKDPYSYQKITMTEPMAIVKDNVDKYYDLGF